MVRITEELIRKRAEHNEKIISTLEELSLHQSEIEKIEYLDKWCRDLKILYLQNNIIPKIENVSRLKKVEYINLALNNVERIENLQGCESLEKLDLTVNFVSMLTDVENLKENEFLNELYLTGNPCTEFEGYRDYVIATLPQLKKLDGIEIGKSERILACQQLAEIRPVIVKQQLNYQRKREKEKKKASGEKIGNEGNDWYTDTQPKNESEVKCEKKTEKLTEQEEIQKFWNEPTEYTPESRLEIHNHIQKQKEKENPKPKPKKVRQLQTPDGRIYNVNEAKVDFEFHEDDNNITLDVALFRFLDTSLCDVDIQPTYIKVTIKGKVLQLTLPEEVKPDSSSAKRSQTTGHLLITMPKMNPVIQPAATQPVKKECQTQKENIKPNERQIQHLEIDPKCHKQVNIANITKEKPTVAPLGAKTKKRTVEERPNSESFVDDSDVPPLM